MHYAIDFGTSNTVVARINELGEVETVKLPDLSTTIAGNPPLIPSLVYVQNAQTADVLVGQEVRDRGLDVKLAKGEQRFFSSFKRAISNPGPGFVPELDGEAVSFARVGGWFLRRIIDRLPEIDSLVFTVPVDSFEPYRQWLSDVCAQLDIKQIRLLDEPTAAALGYGLTPGTQTILTVDFGGGTLDLALVKLNLPDLQASATNTTNTNTPGQNPLGFLLKWGNRDVSPVNAKLQSQTAKVLAKFGINLGGIDIDNWLVDYFHTTQNLPKNSLTTRLAEKVKIALSKSDRASEVWFDDLALDSYLLDLDRDSFEQILKQNQFFDRLDEAVEQINQQAKRQGIELKDIDGVLLVGGTAQIPAVRNWAERHFSAEKVKADRPFEAIAHGALSQGWEIKDFLYHSYGVRFWDKRYKKHGWHPIVKSGQPYPLAEPVELLLGASLPNQPSIELVIGELGEASTEVYFDGDRLVTRNLEQKQMSVQALNDNDTGRAIAQLQPPGKPGSDRIKVLFYVDEQRTLRITVEDLLTNETIVADRAVVQLL
ncbi:Hsp70 family protein [Pseudanabaena sp. PCC 6802]|uniref:Hsp70 family protein n=1 Tax=Pseudanabaena sp. PCC 6802 TaxID=118173 RepID=UPI0003483369|nr:Hsp70 family protein [Pseudanabaena sp. PCC 6802]